MNIPSIIRIAIVAFLFGVSAPDVHGFSDLREQPLPHLDFPTAQSDSLRRMLETQSGRVESILESIEARRDSRDEIRREMRDRLGFLGGLAPKLIRMNDLLTQKEKTPEDWRDFFSLLDSADAAIDATRPAWEPQAVQLEDEVGRFREVWGRVMRYSHEMVADAELRLQLANRAVLDAGNQLRELSREAETESPSCQLETDPAACPLETRRRALVLQNSLMESSDEVAVIQGFLPGLREGVSQIEKILPRLHQQELQLARARHQLGRIQNKLQVMIRETRRVLTLNSIIENYSGLEREVDQFTAAFAELAEEFDALPDVAFTPVPVVEDLYTVVDREAQRIRNSIAYADSLRAGLERARAAEERAGLEGGGR